MKKNKLLFSFLVVCTTLGSSFAQSINWASLEKDQQHILNVNTGWDYGSVFGVGYSYHVPWKVPVLLTSRFSLPFGRALTDDQKMKVGGQVRFFRTRHFQFSAALQGIYRRYENPLVCLQNFGTELTAIAGLYKQRWFLAGELGFDQALFTHFEHTDSFRENIYAGVKDGWRSNTGANFMYGITAGYSFKKSDLSFRIGKTVSRDLKTTPLIPYYLQLGWSFKIGIE